MSGVSRRFRRFATQNATLIMSGILLALSVIGRIKTICRFSTLSAPTVANRKFFRSQRDGRLWIIYLVFCLWVLIFIWFLLVRFFVLNAYKVHMVPFES